MRVDIPKVVVAVLTALVMTQTVILWMLSSDSDYTRATFHDQRGSAMAIEQAGPVLLLCDPQLIKNAPPSYYDLDIDAGTLTRVADGYEDNPYHVDSESRIVMINEYKILFRSFVNDEPINYQELDRRTLVFRLGPLRGTKDDPMGKAEGYRVVRSQCKIAPEKKI